MKDFLLSLAPFTDEELSAILGVSRRKHASAGETMFSPGKPFVKLWFIEKGLIRAYRVIDGEDYTFFFFTKKDFAVDYQSYLMEENSPLFFEALANTQYLEFSKKSIEDLYRVYHSFEHIGRLMAEKAYLSATERVKQFQTETLELRYQKLLERDPRLFQQIPQYHIASYLGVRPQSLSRLRAKLTGKVY